MGSSVLGQGLSDWTNNVELSGHSSPTEVEDLKVGTGSFVMHALQGMGTVVHSLLIPQHPVKIQVNGLGCRQR
jgi:hypothetical protein